MKNPSWFSQSPIKIASNQKIGKPPTGRCTARNDSPEDVRRDIFDRLLITAATTMFQNEDFVTMDHAQDPSIDLKFLDQNNSGISHISPSFSENKENACISSLKICRKVTFSESHLIGSSIQLPSCSISIKLSRQQQPSITTDIQQILIEDVDERNMITTGESHPFRRGGDPETDSFALHHGNLNSSSMDQQSLTSPCRPNGESIRIASNEINGSNCTSCATNDYYQNGVSELPTLDASQQILDCSDSSDRHPLEQSIQNCHFSSDAEQLYSDDEFLKYTAYLRQVHKKRASAMIQLLGAGLTEQTEDIKGYYYDGMDTDELEEKISMKVDNVMYCNRLLSSEMQCLVPYLMYIRASYHCCFNKYNILYTFSSQHGDLSSRGLLSDSTTMPFE